MRIEHVEGGRGRAAAGRPLTVRAAVALGELTPDDVCVEVVYGRAGEPDEIIDPSYQPLSPDPADGAAPDGAALDGAAPDGAVGRIGQCRIGRIGQSGSAGSGSRTAGSGSTGSAGRAVPVGRIGQCRIGGWAYQIGRIGRTVAGSASAGSDQGSVRYSGELELAQPARSVTRSGSCRSTRCWPAGPSSAW